MIKVGCCGFPTSMKRYFETFSPVELNGTFYQYPREKTIEGWRAKASQNFEFTVKAHQDISHKSKLKVNKLSLQAFERMKQICRTLSAKVLLIQTPSSFGPDRLADAEKFFKTVNREGLVLAWETRGCPWETAETRKKLQQVLENLDVAHVTDPLRIMPACAGEIAYFRLHSLGKRMYYYQYTDAELQRLKSLSFPLRRRGATFTYCLTISLCLMMGCVSWNICRGGVFPKITVSTGLSSIREVVEKTRYPISKSMLIKRLGWRLVEVEHGNQIRLETLLRDLHSKTYENVEKLLDDVKTIWKMR